MDIGRRQVAGMVQLPAWVRFPGGGYLQNGFADLMLMPILNRSLARRVKCIHVISNGYKLLEVSIDGFYIDETSFEPSIPIVFEQSELEDPWVRIRPHVASAFRLSFSDEIPYRMFISRQTKNTLPVRQPVVDKTK